MKKVLGTLIAILIVIGVVYFGGSNYIKHNSPEYALANTVKDLQKKGLDGLEGHLTDSAQKKVDQMKEISENEIISQLLDKLANNEKVGIIFDEIDKVTWSVEDVLKGKNSTKIIVAFNYEDQIKGNMEVSMVRENKKWLVESIGMPHFN